jgi:hypothetical protein
MVWRHRSQRYDAYLTVYSHDGQLLRRVELGVIPPCRRRLVDLSQILTQDATGGDHLTVVHRVPERLRRRPRYLPRIGRARLAKELDILQSVMPEEPIRVTPAMDYSFFRSYIEYSFEGGASGNGSVIYEMPPKLNESKERLSNTLTFTTKVWLSSAVNTYLVLMNCSTNPAYTHTAEYAYGFYDPHGTRLASGQVRIRPFTVSILDAKRLIPPEALARSADPEDGVTTLSFVGCSTDTAMPILVLNLDHERRGVSVEHTHPAQAYLMPSDGPKAKGRIKSGAVERWASLLAPPGGPG